MKIGFWQIGLAILFAVAGAPLAGGAPLSTSVGEIPAASTLGLNSRRLNSAIDNPAGATATGDLVAKNLRMLNGRGIRAWRLDFPDRPRLGVDDLIGFVIDSNRYGNSRINIRFNLDRRQSLDWMRFWTDISFSPESEQSVDFSAIAKAAYTPEIRYWLYGARWASFDTTLPGRGTVAADGATDAREEAKTSGGVTAGTQRNSFAAAYNPSSEAAEKRRGKVQATSLGEFLLSIGSKIIRQPIIYVILLVILGILFANSRKRALH